jgi:hypothetical protein
MTPPTSWFKSKKPERKQEASETFLTYRLTLKMEAVCSSETSADIHRFMYKKIVLIISTVCLMLNVTHIFKIVLKFLTYIGIPSLSFLSRPRLWTYWGMCVSRQTANVPWKKLLIATVNSMFWWVYVDNKVIFSCCRWSVSSITKEVYFQIFLSCRMLSRYYQSYL